jgi:hypothetical protein
MNGFGNLVYSMRNAQKDYRSRRTQKSLQRSEQLERLVDVELEKLIIEEERLSQLFLTDQNKTGKVKLLCGHGEVDILYPCGTVKCGECGSVTPIHKVSREVGGE